jgi:hypothetical protein
MSDDRSSQSHRSTKTAPRGDPGAVAYGYFKLIDGVVIMTDADGNPAGGETGKKFSRELRPNEDPVGVACGMTRELRLAFRSGEQRVKGFDGPLIYRRNGSIV